MRIEFNLVLSNEEESKIFPDFLEMLLDNIKSDIISESIPAKLNLLEQDMLNATWILWTSIKPKNINMVSVLHMIVRNIVVYERKNNNYVICINPMVMYPRTKTRLDTIARFIDKGTETCPATCTISRVFNKYNKTKIKDAWLDYINYRLKRKRVSKVIFK